MSEELLESNEVEETTTEENSAQETNTETSMSEEDASKQTTESEKQSEEVDEYADELAKTRKSLELAEKKIVKLKKAPDTDNLVAKVMEEVDKRLGKIEIQTRAQTYDSEIQRVSTSPAEAELIKLTLENKIRPTGNVIEDVASAKLLANQAKILRNNKELARALAVKSTLSPPNFSGGKEEIVDTEVDLAERVYIAAIKSQYGEK